MAHEMTPAPCQIETDAHSAPLLFCAKTETGERLAGEPPSNETKRRGARDSPAHKSTACERGAEAIITRLPVSGEALPLNGPLMAASPSKLEACTIKSWDSRKTKGPCV